MLHSSAIFLVPLKGPGYRIWFEGAGPKPPPGGEVGLLSAHARRRPGGGSGVSALFAPETELLLHRPIREGEQHEILVRRDLAPHPGGRHKHILRRKRERLVPDRHRAAAFGDRKRGA